MSTNPPASPPDLSGTGSIEPTLTGAIASGTLNGAIIFATDSTSTFTYTTALGTRTLLSGATLPQDPTDVLYLASATKLLATIAALQCVEDGLLTLTSDLSPIVPELTSKQVLTGWSTDPDPVPILEPAARPITLAMLLSHSAGTAYDFMVPDLARWNEKFNPYVEGTTRPVAQAFAYPLAFQPGEGWMYGTGLDWAGLIVERLTGRSLQRHVRERIIRAVGGVEEDVEFYPVKGEGMRARLVDLHPGDPEAVGRQVFGGGGDINLRSEGCFGGHGLYMTGGDYVKVLRSLLGNDGRLLKKETVDGMFVDHLVGGAKEGHEKALKGPMGSFFAVGTDGLKVGHGLGGVVTLEGVEGWYGKGTMAWGGGLTLDWFIDRENDLCAISALQAKLPADPVRIAELKQVVRKDIYRKRELWRKA